MKKLKYLFFVPFIFLASCLEESIQEDVSFSDSYQNIPSLEGSGEFHFTKSHELVIEFKSQHGSINFIIQDVHYNEQLMSLDGQNIRIIPGKSSLLIYNEERGLNFVIALNGHSIHKKVMISKKKDALDELERDYSSIQEIQTLIKANGIIPLIGDLNLSDNFVEEFESVYTAMSPGSKNIRSNSAPNCWRGGCGVASCGEITGIGPISFGAVTCASGYFCCQGYSDMAPHCFPCGQCGDAFEGYDPCTGTSTGGGQGPGNVGGGSQTCIYTLTIEYIDGQGEIVETKTYILVGPC